MATHTFSVENNTLCDYYYTLVLVKNKTSKAQKKHLVYRQMTSHYRLPVGWSVAILKILSIPQDGIDANVGPGMNSISDYVSNCESGWHQVLWLNEKQAQINTGV